MYFTASAAAIVPGRAVLLHVFAAKLAKMHGNEQTKRRIPILRAVAVIGGIVGMLVLAACGQKGDLYLPADGPPGQQQNK